MGCCISSLGVRAVSQSFFSEKQNGKQNFKVEIRNIKNIKTEPVLENLSFGRRFFLKCFYFFKFNC